jgi:hypothetical protein
MDGFVCDDTDSRKFEYLFKNYKDFNKEKLDLLRNYSKEYLWLDYSYVNYPEGYDNISIVANSYTMHSIINWMEKSIEGFKNKNSNYIKYVIYSAHDASIGALEHFMKYAFNTEVEYSSFAESRYFELYIDENNEYRVRYLKGENFIKKDLTYKEFKNIINDKTWDDNKVADFCQFEKNTIKKDNNNTFSLIFMISLIILNIIILFITPFFINKCSALVIGICCTMRLFFKFFINQIFKTKHYQLTNPGHLFAFFFFIFGIGFVCFEIMKDNYPSFK